MINIGRLGVDVFFILSGALITLAVGRPKIFDFKRFSIQRIRRIVPCYFASIILIIALVKAQLLMEPKGMLNVLSHLTFTHAFFSHHVTAINSPYWTLSHEWFFYLAAGMSAFVLRSRRPWIFGLCLIIIGLTFRFNLAQKWWEPETMVMHPLGMLIQFGVGSLLGSYLPSLLVILRKKTKLSLLTLASCLVLLAIAVMRFYRFGDAWDTKRSMLLVFPFLISIPIAGLLALGMAWDEKVAKTTRWTPLPWIGQISYSLYIWHVPIMHSWARSLKKSAMCNHPLLSTTLLMSVILAVASLSYYLIEKPFLSQRQTTRRVPT